MTLVRRLLAAAIVSLVALAATGATAAPDATFTRLATIGVGPEPHVAIARTPNGLLHLLYVTTAEQSGVDGLAMRSITPGGLLLPAVQVLSDWKPGIPGLALTPDGNLTAFFGAIPTNAPSGLWGVASSDGGATWSAPALQGSGTLEDLAYGAEITATVSGGTPVLTVPQSGDLVVQDGLGPGAPTKLLSDASDGSAVDVDSAVDAPGGEVVASWESLHGSGGLWLQGVAPTVKPAQHVPGLHRPALVVAGRDSSPGGVYAAWTADGSHVRLLRYGGGSVNVGSVAGVGTSALGVATGPAGRMWVMWGSESGGVAVTRSNKAITKFEPIQHVDPKAFTLYRLYGDGRLGPLDLLVDEIPSTGSGPGDAGTFSTRVLPELSAAAAVTAVKKGGKAIAYVLHVSVTDAGDPVVKAVVKAKGLKKTTNGSGAATIKLPASAKGTVAITIVAAGYPTLSTSARAS